jgi:hypothetical protein
MIVKWTETDASWEPGWSNAASSDDVAVEAGVRSTTSSSEQAGASSNNDATHTVVRRWRTGRATADV